MPLIKSWVTGDCPGGFCNIIKDNSEIVIVLLCVQAFIFLITLIPPLFNWSKKKPDGRKRIYFGILACVTFYMWLLFLAVNTLYCFGFVVQRGPCLNSTVVPTSADSQLPAAADSAENEGKSNQQSHATSSLATALPTTYISSSSSSRSLVELVPKVKL